MTPSFRLCGVIFVVAVLQSQSRMAASVQLYTNVFAVRLHQSGGNGHVDEAAAHRVAKRAGNGFENVGKVSASVPSERDYEVLRVGGGGRGKEKNLCTN